MPASPRLLLPATGRYGLTDYEKILCPDRIRGPDIFDLRHVDRATGALVVVRPAQFVAALVPLEARAALAASFDGFMRAGREDAADASRPGGPATASEEPE